MALSLLDLPLAELFSDWLQSLEPVGLDAALIERESRQNLLYLTATKERRSLLEPNRSLQQRWYRSLTYGTPDYAVYATPGYVAELWSCWAVYSRAYLRALRPFFARLSGIARVVDLGCGLGLSTTVLARLFPAATVSATELPGTFQRCLAGRLAALHGFRVVEQLEALGPPVDLVFASEYFEHFPQPLAHLREVLQTLAPRYLIVANTFGSPSVGHFPAYEERGRLLNGRQTSLAFMKCLAKAGYQKQPMPFWNSRPAVFCRSLIAKEADG